MRLSSKALGSILSTTKKKKKVIISASIYRALIIFQASVKYCSKLSPFILKLAMRDL